MIKNYEFKNLRYYNEVIQQSERKNFLDKYSIIKNFSSNISEGKSLLLKQLGYDDEDNLRKLFEDISDIEIVSDSEFRIGNSKNNVWLLFDILDDGTFCFKGSKQPLKYGRGKVC